MASTRCWINALPAAVLWVACSSGGGGAATGTGPSGSDASTDPADPVAVESQDSGATDAATQKHDAAKPDASKSQPDAAIDTDSDPSNCGGVGHDCRGASCSLGRCAPTAVSQPTLYPLGAIAVAGTDVVILEQWTAGSASFDMKVGSLATTPTVFTTMSTTRVFPVGSYPIDVRIGGGYVYWLLAAGSNGGDLKRRPLAGTNTPEESVAANVAGFVVDATEVAWATYALFGGTPGVYVASHANLAAAKRIPTSASDPMYGVVVPSLGKDSSSLYVMDDNQSIHLLPSNGGASSSVGVGLPNAGYVGAFATGPGRFYGTAFQRSNPVECQTTTTSLWTLTPGGTTTVLYSGAIDNVQGPRADAHGMAIGYKDCATPVEHIHSWLEARGSTDVVIADFSFGEPWAVAGDWLYYVGVGGGITTGASPLVRVAR